VIRPFNRRILAHVMKYDRIVDIGKPGKNLSWAIEEPDDEIGCLHRRANRIFGLGDTVAAYLSCGPRFRGRWPCRHGQVRSGTRTRGSLQGAISALYSSSWASVRPWPPCSHPLMASSVSCHHRAHGLPPRTTSVVASWRMFSRPQRSKSTDSVRPKVGSYPRDVHHSPRRYAPW
jgi:hypothetical protein